MFVIFVMSIISRTLYEWKVNWLHPNIAFVSYNSDWKVELRKWQEIHGMIRVRQERRVIFRLGKLGSELGSIMPEFGPMRAILK